MVKVKRATLEDLHELHKIYTDAAQYKHEFNDSSWRDGFSRNGVRWMIKQGTTYAATEDNKIIGVTALEWQDEGWGELEKGDAGYIKRLAVAKEQRGNGIGGFILDWALQEVAKNNRKYLRLDCSTQNTSLCNYYETQGFMLVKTVTWPSDAGEEIESNLYQKGT